jgi:hypothetical protein
MPSCGTSQHLQRHHTLLDLSDILLERAIMTINLLAKTTLHALELKEMSIHALELVQHQTKVRIHVFIGFRTTGIVEGVRFHRSKTPDTRLLGIE